MPTHTHTRPHTNTNTHTHTRQTQTHTHTRRACCRGVIGSTIGTYPRGTGSNPVEENGLFSLMLSVYLSSFFDTHKHMHTHSCKNGRYKFMTHYTKRRRAWYIVRCLFSREGEIVRRLSCKHLHDKWFYQKWYKFHYCMSRLRVVVLPFIKLQYTFTFNRFLSSNTIHLLFFSKSASVHIFRIPKLCNWAFFAGLRHCSCIVLHCSQGRNRTHLWRVRNWHWAQNFWQNCSN